MPPSSSRKFVLNEVPVIDQHSHMYLDEARSVGSHFFVRVMSLEAYNPDYVISADDFQKLEKGDAVENKYHKEVFNRGVEAGRTSLFLVESLNEMARFLGCADDLDTIMRERNKRSGDLKSYAGELYKDARLKTLILSDYRFRSTVGSPIQTKNKLVIHTVLFSSLDGASSLSEALNAFCASLEEHIKKKGFVGMKSMIAYGGIRRGTGLDIGNPDEQTVNLEFLNYKSKQGKVEGRELKNLEDHFTRRALEYCVKLDVPLEFHTGIGDLDVITDKCNPMLLGNLLKDEELRKAKVILLHGSYPYVAEGAWMAHFFPNVYLDCSILFYTHHLSAVKRFEEALEMAPYSKLLYSSDGGVLPESHWFAAKSAKRALEAVLSQLVSAETLSENEAFDLGERFFHKNAEALFRLN